MATLVSIATGNFTAAGTWGVVNSTAYLDSEAASTAISTSNLDSAAFTPGAITVDRISVKIASLAASPSGTFTATLRNSSAGSDVASVTVNVSDLPSLGWAVFNIGSQTLLDATNYLIRVVCSTTGSQVTLYRNATANNWSRLLVTTTTGAPASADQLHINGELTGAGTGNNVTVTMDNTATTSFGPTVSGGPPQSMTCGNRGTLTLGTTASTAYYLKWKGVFAIWGGGTVNFGTSGSRLPASSSLTIFLDSATNDDAKLARYNGGTLNIYGADKLGKTTLSADEAAAQTVLSITATTGWQASDQIGLAPTGASTHHERRTISTVDSATQVTVTAGLTNAHAGSGELICTVVNLTRNIKLQGASTSLRGNLLVVAGGSGSVTLDCLEIVADTVGSNSTNNRLVDLQLTTATIVTVTNCTINPGTEGAGNARSSLYVSGATADSFDINGLIHWRWLRPAVIISQVTSGTAWKVRNCVAVGHTELTAAFDLNSTKGEVLNNEAWTCLGGINYTELGTSWSQSNANRFDGNKAYFCTDGIVIGDNTANLGMGRVSIKNTTTKRNTRGIKISSNILLFTNLVHISIGDGGNSPQGGHVRFNGAGTMLLEDFVGASEASFACQSGFVVNGGSGSQHESSELLIYAYNSSFGVASGSRQVYVDAAFRIYNVFLGKMRVICNSCVFGSSTKVITTGPSVSGANFNTVVAQQECGDHIDNIGSFVRSQRHDQTNNNNKLFVAQGTSIIDTVIFRTATPALRMTPTTASYKLRSEVVQVPVNSSASLTISAWVRKSASGDAGGADYNGSQQRLILRRNDDMGILVDTVIDTAVAAVGTWEELTGVATASATKDGVLEFYVDCDGTVGWVNVDDWVVS